VGRGLDPLPRGPVGDRRLMGCESRQERSGAGDAKARTDGRPTINVTCQALNRLRNAEAYPADNAAPRRPAELDSKRCLTIQLRILPSMRDSPRPLYASTPQTSSKSRPSRAGLCWGSSTGSELGSWRFYSSCFLGGWSLTRGGSMWSVRLSLSGAGRVRTCQNRRGAPRATRGGSAFSRADGL